MEIKVKQAGKKRATILNSDKMDVVMEKPRFGRSICMKYDFSVDGVEGKAGEFLVVTDNGDIAIMDAIEYLSAYDMPEYMFPIMRYVSVGLFAEFMLRHGISTDEVAQVTSVIKDVIQLTDGKKPVYIVSLANYDTPPEEAQALQDAMKAADLAGIVVPKDFLNVEGVVFE